MKCGRKHRIINYNGKKYTLDQLALEFKLTNDALKKRLQRNNQNIYLVLNNPKPLLKKRKSFARIKVSLREGIELYHFVMNRWYSRRLRNVSYRELKRDFAAMQA